MQEHSFSWFLVLAVSGVLGTLCRYGAIRLVEACMTQPVPFGTLFVNVAGAFLAGFFFVYFRRRFPEYGQFLPFILIGFLGAFTTFSTFALECADLIRVGAYAKAAVNFTLQNLLGITAASLGLVTASACCPSNA